MAKAKSKPIKLKPLPVLMKRMRIACLDLETLDTDITNSIIYDVAVVVTDVDIYADTVLVSNSSNLCLKFDLVEQMLFGRTSSPGTIKFHVDRMPSPDLATRHAMFTFILEDIARYKPMLAKDGLEAIRKAVEGADEIWINGLSFDCSLLKTLATQCGYTKGLWAYNTERDVRTIYRTVPKDTATFTEPAHDALEDAKWNLQVAIAYNQYLVQHPLLTLKLPNLTKLGYKST